MRKARKLLTIWSNSGIAILWLAASAYAVPSGFNVQGRLTDSNGVNRNGAYALRFTIFDATANGNALWSKTIPSISVQNGNFQTIVGDPADNPAQTIAASVTGDLRFLEIQVVSGPGLSNPDPPLVPRQQLVSVPFSLEALSASSLSTNVVVVNGNVGVGTNSPAFTLDVAGSVNGKQVCIAGNCQTSWPSGGSAAANPGGSSGQVQYNSSGAFSGANLFYNPIGGAFGVGTAAPGYKLDVAGAINGTQVCIAGNCQTSWPSGGSGSANPGGSSGQLQYNSSGAFAGANLTYDAATGNLGIGTTNPLAPLTVGGQVVIGTPYRGDASLHIESAFGCCGRLTQIEPGSANTPAMNLMASHDGNNTGQWWTWGVNGNTWTIQPGVGFSGTAGLFINSNGGAGIGTPNPVKTLDIRGDSVFYSANTPYSEGASVFYTGSAATGGGINLHLGGGGAPPSAATLKGYLRIRGTNSNIILGRYNGGDSIPLEVNYNTGDLYLAQSVGNVGVGTSAPGYKLDVAGAINGAQVCIAGICQSSWPAGSGSGAAGGSTGQIQYNSSGAFAGANLTYDNATGNLGIGVFPGSKLDVNGRVSVRTDAGGTPLLLLGRTSDNLNQIITLNNAGTSYTGRIEFLGNGDMALDTGSGIARRMYIQDATGGVGVGTVTPQDQLDVAADISMGGCLRNEAHTVNYSGNCVSDARVKKNITLLSGALEKLAALRPVSYGFNDGKYGRGLQDGLIAQEVEKVFPQWVTTGSDGYKRVNYGVPLTMEMLEAIKELQEENKALAARIEKLERQGQK